MNVIDYIMDMSSSCFLELASTFMWTELGYAKNFEPYTQFEDNCPRIHAPDVSCEEFIERFEKPYIPCVITNIQEGWKAQSKWVGIKITSSLLSICLMIVKTFRQWKDWPKSIEIKSSSVVKIMKDIQSK